MKSRLSIVLRCVSIVGAFLALFQFALAAEPVQSAEKGKPDAGLREQSIYVPYEKLWQVFEKKGRGVFLPYEDFLELWKAAEAGKPRTVKAEPPVPALISEVSGVATVSKDVMSVEALVQIEVLKKGWHKVALGLGDVAIKSAEIGGKPARLLRGESGYELVVEKKDDTPERLTLALSFAKSYTKSPGRNSVSFATPPAPVSRWDIRIPEPGVKVDVQPLLAATDVPDAGPAETRVLAFVGAAPSVRVEWTPKSEGARGLQALANVKAEHRISLEEGVVRNKVTLIYEISRTEVARLRVAVPAGEKIVNVFDPNVREWSVAEEGGEQIVTVQLFEPARGTQALSLELERFSDSAQTVLPVVRALDASRQQGVVAVGVAVGLRVEPARREGLLQMDARDLPASLAGGRWNSFYRYAALPFALELKVEKVQPRILADSLVEIHVRPEELQADVFTVFDVQDAGVFQLSLDVPAGLEVRSVEGREAAGAQAAQVGRHRVEVVEGKSRVTVELSRKALGKTGVAVQLRRVLKEPDLLAPTGKAAEIALPTPQASGPSVVRAQGRAVVYAPESLRVNLSKTKGVRVVPLSEAVEGMPRVGGKDEERVALAMMYADESADAVLSAERRAPHVTVRQLLVARIESGVIKYEATFFADVLYSGIRTLRVDVPKSLGEQIRVTTPDVRRRVLTAGEAPADVAEGYAAWLLEGDAEFMGSRQIALRWETKMAEMEVGRPVELVVPSLEPKGVDRAWGQVFLVKAESIHVSPTDSVGLRPIDPRQDLMAGASVKDAAQAFEFHGLWRLAASATRYEPKDVKSTSIERGLVRMVVTRSDVTSVQALYRMRSARQRLEIRLPESVQFDTQPLKLNGRPVSLEQGEKGAFYVPLVGIEQDQAFLLDIRYLVNGAGTTFLVPEFPEEPAVQQVYLSIYMPEERSFLGSAGPWNDEIVWTVKGFSAWPRANRTADDLLAWVSQGVVADRDSLGGFAVDGRHLLFSTLRPVPGGALRVVALRGVVLQALLLIIIVLMGALLLPATWTRRALAVGAAFVGMVLLAVFTPAFARAVVNNGTAAAVVIVGAIWGLWFIVVSLPQIGETIRKRTASRGAPPPVPPGLSEPEKPQDPPASTGSGVEDGRHA